VSRAFLRSTITILALLGLCTVSMAAADRTIRGVVADESGGVLPGETVVATGEDGRVLATGVTDGAGRYTLGPLAAGRVTVTFELAGFARANAAVTLSADADAVLNQRLLVAPQSETVDVLGRAPVPFPPPAPPVVTPVRRKPTTRPVPEHDPGSVCGPAKLEGLPESFGTVRARRAAANGLYSEGDELLIDGGTFTGLEVGRNFVVRRTYRVEWDPRTEIGEHTAGLVQIVAADEHTATAVVIYACDEMMPGDWLAAFMPLPRTRPAPAGRPDYRHALAVLFPDLGQLLGAPRRMLVIEGGSAAGVRVGQRLVIFRRRAADGARVVVGDAIVVAVRRTSATIRVDRVTDAIFPGDMAAIER
jgi:hypothetical protein